MTLRKTDLEVLQRIFASTETPLEVWAYGSRVNGSAHEGSDLDLVIRGKDLTRIDIDLFLDLKDQIRESNIPILVEVLDWARIPESFQRNIEQHFEVIFESKPSLGKEPKQH